MEKIIIQITSGRGPVECCRVVAKVAEMMLEKARKKGIGMEVLENKKGDLNGTLLSSTIMAKGIDLEEFSKEWCGTIQWIAQSPYRKFYKRKNWFVGVAIFNVEKQMNWDAKDVVFETCRASGPGGQHVNKVETAVRGTHTPTGIQVLASDHRSQLQNKKACLERLEAKVLAWQTAQLMAQQQSHWLEHNSLERGNAVKTIIEKL
ncbi:peptide chain release factor H [Chitinophagaceae bacterium LB-8]|jgi:peptide chain release factor|uniref:Peptide chain release factor H n=1 Tax=Paraflavisolibacter caeni TaxID=2982496 RepID=A0A9X2XPB6_9BACT|nr:peptide chain release factor H [Paraflavisolibacter caeni]MCU7550469.1 peptide chain release factor H [Paraflavisolibacter caeni]